MNDFKFACRQWLKNPGFTAVAVLTLALGIGATTAITSVVRTALFDPLPVADADRFLTLNAKVKLNAHRSWGLNPLAAREAQANTNLFRRVALWEMADAFRLEGDGLPQNRGGHRVTREFFTMFPVAPLLGRLPSTEEARAGAAPVFVLGYAAWRRIFAGDPSIVGRAVRFKQGTVTIIGVMPPNFSFPRAKANDGYWQPWCGPSVRAGDALDGHDSLPNTGVIGDLREYAFNEEPKPTIYRAKNRAFPHHLIIRTPVSYSELRPAIERELKAVGADDTQPWVQFVGERLFESTAGHRTLMRFLLFFAGVGLALAAIGLYGVLAYSVSRRTREIGIRVAIGAQRGDVLALILRQGLVLVLAGVTIGLAISLAATRALKSFLFGVPAHDPATFTAAVLALAAVAMLACWLPARRATKVDPMVALRCE